MSQTSLSEYQSHILDSTRSVLIKKTTSNILFVKTIYAIMRPLLLRFCIFFAKVAVSWMSINHVYIRTSCEYHSREYIGGSLLSALWREIL